MEQQPKIRRCWGGWTEKVSTISPSPTTWDSLPTELIHRIQRFLPVKDAYRTCVLSRACLSAWSTTPYLVFREPFENKIVSNMERRRRGDWIRFIDDTFSRYDLNKLIIERLELILRIETVDLVPLVNRWLKIAAERGIRHCHFESYFALRHPNLPLEVHPAEFGFGFGRWRSLQILVLRLVNIQEEEINNLFINDNCPFLERIMLQYCKGFKKIKVVKLDRLREFGIRNSEETVVEIEDTPSLCTFTYVKAGNVTNACFSISETCCRNLKNLTLYGITMDEAFLGRLISRLPSLERFDLRGCYTLHIINIISGTLKDLTLKYCDDAWEVNIYAPKLNLFCFGGSELPTLSFGNLMPVKTETMTEQPALNEPFTWKFFF